MMKTAGDRCRVDWSTAPQAINSERARAETGDSSFLETNHNQPNISISAPLIHLAPHFAHLAQVLLLT
jgi:hypothetical protein